MRSFIPVFLLAMLGGVTGSTMAVKDVNKKKGTVMYKAMYVNQAANRTRAVFDGNFAVFDGTTPGLNGNSRVTTYFSMQVMDKKGQPMPWVNLFSIATTDFPASVIPASFGISPNSIASETYQLSAYDKSTKALLGSLVWGASWSDGGDFGVVTQVFPVLGATGVFARAKAVGVTYQTDNTRQVTIYKSAF